MTEPSSVGGLNLGERAVAVLRTDDRGAYTVPSPRLYPYQWLWDSAFIALGWSAVDEKRAWLELETLLAAQWEDGMLPHIVFHEVTPEYFPGPGFWGASGPLPGTGITQPPVLATVMRRLVETCRDKQLAERKARLLAPRILAWHRWFYRARDPGGSGLVAILHPWESGMDNSPLWDEALSRVPPAPLPELRRDTRVVAAEQRPHLSEYERYLSLVATFRELDYDADRLHDASPFRVADVLMNAVLHRANRDLKWLLKRTGVDDDGEVDDWLQRTARGLQTLWDEEDGFFYPRDLISGEPIRIRTFEGFMPLYAGAASSEQAQILTRSLAGWLERVPFGLACVDPDSPVFEPRRYWRGPVWINVNWMLRDGLLQYGAGEQAQRLQRDSFKLAEESGFFEYFDPLTGDGLGGDSFAWTAALLLDWLAEWP